MDQYRAQEYIKFLPGVNDAFTKLNGICESITAENLINKSDIKYRSSHCDCNMILVGPSNSAINNFAKAALHSMSYLQLDNFTTGSSKSTNDQVTKNKRFSLFHNTYQILTSKNLNLSLPDKFRRSAVRELFTPEKFCSLDRNLLNFVYSWELINWSHESIYWMKNEFFTIFKDPSSFYKDGKSRLLYDQKRIYNLIFNITQENVENTRRLLFILDDLKECGWAYGRNIILKCENQSLISDLHSIFNTIDTPYDFKDLFPNVIKFDSYTAADFLSIFKINASNYYNVSRGACKFLIELFTNMLSEGETLNEDLVLDMVRMSIENVSNRIKNKIRSDKNLLDEGFGLEIEIKDVENAANSILKFRNKKQIITNRKPSIKNDNHLSKIYEYKNNEHYNDLMSLVGLEDVKVSIDNIIVSNQVSRFSGFRNLSFEPKMNMSFVGNPGTAKTTVARKLYKILKDLDVVSGDFIEVNRSDLVGKYAGSSDELIKKTMDKAKHGILFIDEAYSLVEHWADNNRGHGGQVIDAVASEMSSGNRDIMFIFAGYPKEMESFFNENQTIKSNLQYMLTFDDYTPNQLYEIFMLKAKQKGFSISKKAKKASKSIFSLVYTQHNYGNGRFVDNLLDQAISRSLLRISKDCSQTSKFNNIVFEDLQVPLLDNFGIDICSTKMSATNKLELLVGLDEVKKQIKAIISNNIMDKKRSDANRDYEPAQSTHMIFNGNPGTAKTTVARLFADVLRENNVQSGRFIECSSMDFLGTYLGDVKDGVRDKFRDAKGGILFIDEAYGLNEHKDAIDEINYQLENNRDRTICIFAGYTDKMEQFLNANPGLKSRVNINLTFPDYSSEELCEIFVQLASERGFTISNGARVSASKIFEKAQNAKNFGNGRYARKLLDKSIQNQSQRLWQELEENKSKQDNKKLFRIIQDDVRDDEVMNSEDMTFGFA